jgi:hypothetical protein
MEIEPETKIVQSDFGRQPSLKVCQVVRTLTRQAKGVQEFVVDGLDDLSHAGQPAPQRFGPARPLAALMWWGHQVHQMLVQPLASRSFSGKAFIGHIGAVSRQAGARQPRRWVLTSSKQGRRRVLADPKPNPVMTPRGVTDSSR